MAPNISIIVPVFNGEKYIQQCLNSILIQSYKNYEIIILNDGSTDNTAKICDMISLLNSNICYFYHENMGVSKTRNKGIRLARGNYIVFVDVDDYLELDYLKNLLTGMKNSDIAVLGYKMFIDKKLRKNYEEENKTLSRETFMQEVIVNDSVKGYLWNKIFRKDIIDKYSIYFREDCYIGEDTEFILEYSKHIKTAQIISYVGYNYMLNDKGTMRTSFKTENLYKVLSHMDSIERMLKYDCFTDLAKRELIRYYTMTYAKIYRKMYKTNNSDELKNFRMKIEKYRNLDSLDIKSYILVTTQLMLPRIFNTLKND